MWIRIAALRSMLAFIADEILKFWPPYACLDRDLPQKGE